MNRIILLILIFIIGLTSQVTFASTFTVTNNADNGSGSLRDAITNVLLNDGDIIQFDHDYTINLTSGELAIGKSITIDGSNHKVTVIGGSGFRVFNITSSATVTLNNLTIQNGNADNGDGGGIFSDGSLTINNCTITGNVATNNGGGIYINSGTVTINNSTLSANSAQSGGGGIFNNSNVVINNSTLFGNNGVGIYNNGTLELKNTIIANSTGGNCNNTTSGSITSTSTNNLIQDNSCNLKLSGDPQLGTLKDNGGPTPTHALSEGSIAIDAGDPATCLSPDQRGQIRGTTKCDIGAFEFNHAPIANDTTFTTTTNTNLSNILSATDADGDNLTYSIDNSSSLGTVTLTDSATGAFTYIPPLNKAGIKDTFTYKVKDNALFDSLESAVKTVTIKIVNNIVVDNAGDTDDGDVGAGQNTLREAITHALSGDMITFANSLANQTITIDKKNGPLVLNKALIIDGAGQNITLSGGNNSRLFQIDSGNVTINHLTMRDSKSADGGAIHVNNGALFLNDCTIANNKNIGNSHQGGGLFIGTGAVVEINRCLIDSNSANGNPGHGGGIFNQGQLTLNNSTVTNNDANKGGGGLYNGASAEINNSTFSANSTAQQNQGSNLYNGGTLQLRNTILANYAKNGGDCTNAGTINPNLNNLIGDGTCNINATNLKTGDPKLIGLQANGTFALSDGSPAIDAGDNSTCLATDQLGKLRPIDGNNDSSAICDIGAVEKDLGVVPQLDAAAPSVISTDPTDTATGIDPTAAVTINFSESVNATVSSFSLECPAGTAILFNLSASPATTFTLTPTSNLPSGTSCQVIVNQISDVDNIDPPDNLSGNDRFSFQTVNPPPPQPTKPSPPTNLQAVSIVATETMKLSWDDNSDNETGFKIVRDGNLLSTTAADITTYQDSPLKCGTEYTYSVTAINTVGESLATTLTVSTWNCPTIPSPPTNLQAVPIVATQTMGLSWDDNSDNETGFKIARDGKPLSTTTAANTTTYQDSPLKCGTEYTYSVTAINTVGESAAATITVSTWDCPTPPPIIVVDPDPLVPPTDNTTTPPTTDQPPIVQPPTTVQLPIAPIKLNVVATSPTEVTLTWNDTSHDEIGFKIERNGILTQITAANVTTYKDTELTCNTTYNYAIKATNASGDSAALTASITTPICATKPLVPSNLKVIATSPTSVNLSWTDNSDNETGFKIERDGTVVHMSLATVTSYQDNGLTCGTSYHYQVIATNATGDSAALTQTITTLPCTSIDSLPSTPMSLEISFIGDGQAQIKTYAAEIACDSSKAICTHDVKVPTTVILVATAAKGSQFFAWEGDCQSKSDSIEFILNTNRHCIAHFKNVPQDNANNTSNSKDPKPCLVDNSPNCNPLPPVNHPPTDITLSNQRIDENSPGGTFIGKLTTLDSDVNEAHQYTLLDDASHTFILRSDELHLTEYAQLDFETIPSYTILVRSTDSQGAFLDKTFTIDVNHTDQAQFLGKVFTADWQVGKDMTIDAPETVNLIGYIKPQAIHIGQIADIIAIYDWTPAQEDQPVLSVPVTLAHQIPLQADMQFSLYEGRLIGLAGMLKVTLSYQLNQNKSFAGQIITLNINPNRPPTDIYISNHTVMENSQPNTVIGWLATTDPDQQDQFTYGLVDNPGNYFTIVGNELRVNRFHFNYADGATYPIQVRSVDMTGAYVDKSFTIEVTDTQSQLKDIQLTKTAVFENSPKGFIVGRLWIQDDEQSHYQYELIEDAQGRFTLMNDLILVAKDDEFDFENQIAYPIVVRSTQTDTHQVLEKTFTIDILNVIDVTVRGELYDVTHQSIDSSKLRSADKVIIELQLIPDQTHQGQLAVLFSVALWVADSGQTRIYIFNGDTWVEWNGDWATLNSIQPITLQDHHKLTLWQNKLPNFSSGQFHIFGGYRLKNGEVVYSPQPFDISIP